MPISEGPSRAGDVLKARSRSALGSVRIAAEVTVFVIALIWLVQGFNVLDGYGLDRTFAAYPRNPGSLPDIVFIPLLHASAQHIESNTPPLALLTFLTALDGLRRYVYVTGFVVVVSGFATWLVSPTGVPTVGASGLIFGYLGYLVARGVVARSIQQALWQVPLGLALFAYYRWTVVLLYPSAIVTAMNISWQAHLCGLLSGITIAVLLRRRVPHSDE